ncbi:MAG: homogentisate 1,2-dioxygenase [Alphaproteobacteria bacterium]|nr:homogentisate 1,2-dioxygenase [Alphaproteobacteria bacterium]MBO6864839.1 homogentisate 1,2-dioxygenase [Alphaproteobacteria bacterium]
MSGEAEMLSGFGNEFESEAVPGALPQGRNNPQRCPFDLYAEQLSGTAFTAPNGENRRTWLYRMRPSVRHSGQFARYDAPYWKTAPHRPDHQLPLGPYRWNPVGPVVGAVDFVDAIRTMTTAGDAPMLTGMAAHVFSASRSMTDRCLINADAEMLIAPWHGRVEIVAETGRFEIAPLEVAILPRGMAFQIRLPDGAASGYVLENYGAMLRLPDRGPIGANGLANPRDFKSPRAWFEDREEPMELIMKWGGALHAAEIPQSPFDVVAWHGNYVPVKYDLTRFNTMGSISFDHPDPSIFTVLTSPSEVPGTANIDFVIFPERWLVAEDTFRPPWYHRNVMSEFMGNLCGAYDAKPNGFPPGAMSLHNCMIPHGPDAGAFKAASTADLKPHKLSDTMAFMFETRYPQFPTRFAAEEAPLQTDYAGCWAGIEKLYPGR